MGDTIEEIGDRVNPSRVKENVKNRARSAMRDLEHEVNEAGRGVWDTIRENPIPAGLVGVGLAWLVANGASSSRRHSEYEYDRFGRPSGGPRYVGMYAERDYYDPYEPAVRGRVAVATGRIRSDVEGEEWDDEEWDEDRGPVDRARDKMEDAKENVKERASHAADSARDKVSEMSERVHDRAEHAVDRTRERASEMVHSAGRMTRDAGHRARRAERRVEDAVQENPLAAGAIAAALGFAAGMMIPESDREREMFGPSRDRLVERAERTARRAGAKAKDVARETAGDAAKAAVDEVMHAEDRGGRESVTEPGR